MEARQADALPDGPAWQFEPKWDGFRAIAIRNGGRAELYGKSGKPLGRYFPEILARLIAARPKRFAVDGEIAIERNGGSSFEALQARLHPAQSRIEKLSREMPAVLILFDALMSEEEPMLWQRPLAERRDALERLFLQLKPTGGFRLSPATTSRATAQKWLKRAGGGSLDGVVAKARTDPYRFGDRAMVKVKCLRTADCVVGGFRYQSGPRLVGSLLLGLYDAHGLLHHVGFTSGIRDEERKPLTRRLEALRSAPGFTGSAPGGPSRWSTERSAEWEPLKPELVVEVRYDHVTGDRFRHGTKFLRFRPDIAPRACTFAQLHREESPRRLEATLIGKTAQRNRS